MERDHRVRLTASEIASLWGGHLGDSMANCVLRYFLSTVEDKEIKSVLEYAYKLTEEHLAFKNEVFTRENFPIPYGFTEEDVDCSAPRLYSDIFMLLYIRQMGIGGVAAYSASLGVCARTDLREFFNHNLKTAAELLNNATTLMLEKGLFVRSPFIEYPKEVEFVQKEGWINGWFGDRRPVNVAEITHLYLNTLTNSLGKDLMIGFSQVSKSKEFVDCYIRGRDISTKHVEVFGSLLRDDHLPAPVLWDSSVSDSTTAPFSEKLMLFQTATLCQLGMGNYGAALSASPRRDLAAIYLRLAAEIGTFADDCAELMIKNHWLEKMPGALERDELRH